MISQEKQRELETNLQNTIFRILNYSPHQKQALIHNSPARFRVAICGRRFGKSLMAAKEVESIICNPATPNKRVWIVAPTYSLADKVFREVWNDLIIGSVDKITKKKRKRVLPPSAIIKKSENDRIIKTAWGSEVIGKSADRPDSLVGDALDLLIFDECAKSKQRIWEQYLRPTLTDRMGKALFITTPEGRNWIYDLYLRGETDNKDWASFSFASSLNPHLPIKDIVEAKSTLTTETFKQEYMADFVTYAGQVYKDFDISTHVIRDLPEFDYTIMGIDYGYVNPTALIVIGIKDGRYYIAEEVYKSGMLLNEIESELKRLKKKWNFKNAYADHKPEYNKPLTKAGIPIIIAKKDVPAGIEKVSQKMKIQPDGKPLIMFHYSCDNAIREHENYRYPETKDSQNDKEEPVKDHDHSCDAIRYAIFTRETKPVFKTGRIRGIN